MRFDAFDDLVESTIPLAHNVAALSLSTSSLKRTLHSRIASWKLLFGKKLHESALATLTSLSDSMKSVMSTLALTETV
jgi:hypothetical protein